STKVPIEYRAAYLAKGAVSAAIRGDPALQSLKNRYLRRNRRTPTKASKTLGVTITRPAAPRAVPAQPQRQTPPSTVHIKRLRTRSATTAVVTPEASTTADATMRAAELATFMRLNRKILAGGSKRKILAACLTAAVKLSRAERGFLGIEGAEGSLDIVCAQNMDREEVRLAKNAFSLRMAERCVITGKVISSSDAAHDPLLRRHSSLLGIGVRSVLAVPFCSSIARGVIYLDHRFQRGAFNRHQQTLIQGLADQAGIVYELADSPESSETLKLPKMDFATELSSEKVYRLDPFLGTSDFMEDLYNRSPGWAESKESLLIIGETGSGKQTLAKTVHKLGPRKREPLVILDCRTVPDDLVETELFGQIAGVYEGASERLGLLRAAGKGTLVIDGLWQASELVKSRLLTALRSRLVRPLGSDQAEDFDARIITLAPDVGAHRLRQNVSKSLFALISAETMTLSPLRERSQDIAFVLQDMLLKLSAQSGSPLKTVEKEALDVFLKHPWFGNYWELKKAISDAWKSAGGNEVIRVADLPTLEHLTDSSESEVLIKDESVSLNLDEALKRTQREMILNALDLAADREEAATLLGIQRRKLNRLIKKLDIET
ncbi:MAG: sigma 54-interacting transcriptional regulator, partial [Planctomycetota bacterium]|nr:sigma 54-interacting transcriptional regulator [Planctomycetota bacterium]